MFFTQAIPRSTLVGSYVVEQHSPSCLRRYVEDLPRPDLTFGKDHPLAQSSDDERRAA